MIKIQFARIVTKAVQATLPHMNFQAKILLADAVLRNCGFGAGGIIAESNERVVLDVIQSNTPTLIDVGGHRGQYTSNFIHRFPGGRAIVFEPVQRHFELLELATKKLKNVSCFRVALSDFEGNAAIYRDQTVSGLASLS